VGDFRCHYSETGYFVQFSKLMHVEILVLGTGDSIMFVQRAREALAKMGMQVDVQDTVEALFDKMLTSEKRCEYV
jgi:uncharacterized protein